MLLDKTGPGVIGGRFNVEKDVGGGLKNCSLGLP